MGQWGPNLVTPMRFTSLESALTFHAVGEEAAGGEGENQAMEVPSCAPARKVPAALQPSLPWSKLGMGLLPRAGFTASFNLSRRLLWNCPSRPGRKQTGTEFPFCEEFWK